LEEGVGGGELCQIWVPLGRCQRCERGRGCEQDQEARSTRRCERCQRGEPGHAAWWDLIRDPNRYGTWDPIQKHTVWGVTSNGLFHCGLFLCGLFLCGFFLCGLFLCGLWERHACKRKVQRRGRVRSTALPRSPPPRRPLLDPAWDPGLPRNGLHPKQDAPIPRPAAGSPRAREGMHRPRGRRARIPRDPVQGDPRLAGIQDIPQGRASGVAIGGMGPAASGCGAWGSAGSAGSAWGSAGWMLVEPQHTCCHVTTAPTRSIHVERAMSQPPLLALSSLSQRVYCYARSSYVVFYACRSWSCSCRPCVCIARPRVPFHDCSMHDAASCDLCRTLCM